MSSSAISSRKSVPPWACSNRPRRRATAPVNAPFSWPNSSLSKRPALRAALVTFTNGPPARSELRWMAAATNSLPVPLSPVMSTGSAVGATRPMVLNTCTIAGVRPISSSSAPPSSSGSTDSACTWATSARCGSARRTVNSTSSRSNGLVT
jgi:hypothetical protein